MSVQTFTPPNASGQAAAAWPGIVDNAVSVLARLGDIFSPHAAITPNMTVLLDPGHLKIGTNLIEVAAQATGTITAPVTNPRIDRVVIDNTTGTVSVITGTEAVSPVAPALIIGKSPVAQVLLQTTSTSIMNSMITDERDFGSLGLAAAGGLINVQTFASAGTFTYTPTTGASKVIVEVLGGGASGGGCAANSASTGSAASGGGAGAYAKAQVTSGFSGVTITVGAGGAAPAAGANDGNDGGDSSFGTLVVAGGGKHGRGGASLTPPVTQGSAGVTAYPTGANIIGGVGARGGSTLILGINTLAGGGGAPSVFGAGGEPGGNAAGGAGITAGAGGGGASSIASGPARAGGAGAAGIVIVSEYA